MVNVQMFRHESELRANDVVVGVVRELGPQSVGWLRRLSSPDGVGKDDEVTTCIKWLPCPEKLSCEPLVQHVAARPGCAVKHQHRHARRVSNGLIVNSEA